MGLIHQRMHGQRQVPGMNAQRTHPVATFQRSHIDHDAIEHLHQVIQGNEQVRTAIALQVAAVHATSKQP